MSIRHRIARTAAVLAIAGTSALCLAPAAHAAVPGPGDIVPCTHDCHGGGGGGGGGQVGPGDLTSNPPGDPDPKPQPNPDPEPETQSDAPVVVSHPTFTG
jgi:hypothetical protein